MKKRFAIIVAVLMVALFTSQDVRGQQWVQMNVPLVDNIDVDVFCFAASKSALFAGTHEYGIIRSTDSGFNWSYANAGMNQNAIVNALMVTGSGNSTLVFAATDSGIYGSTDTLWKRMSTGLTNDTVNALAQLNNGSINILFAGTNNALFRSTDSGASWVAANSGLMDSSVSCFTTLGQIIFAGTNRQSVSGSMGFYRSTDEGRSWTGIDTSLLARGVISMVIGGTVISPILFASVYDNGFVCSSPDSGRDWEIRGGPWPYSVSSLQTYGDTLFAAIGYLGYSTDSGTSWPLLFDEIAAHNEVNTLMRADSYFFLGANAGIWRASLEGESNVESMSQSSPSFTSNPNPFTQSTTITFTSPENGAADVSVVNILGTEVARIFSGELTAGVHSFSWDATGMFPGMYECVVTMNGRVQRGSMMVE